mgnify:CR=1 FL=1
MATIKEIADMAGVSIATVSYVLNNTGKISAETRKKVIETAQTVGYVTNINNHLMHTRQYGNIGVVFDTFKGGYYYTLLEGLGEQVSFRKHTLHLMLGNHNEKKIIENLLSANVDAVIIHSRRIEDSAIHKLKSRGIPMVFLDREIEDDMISSVLTDNVGGITSTMEHLISTGHRRIAFMQGTTGYDGRKRFEAYQKVMKQYSLPIEESLIMRANFDKMHAEYEFTAKFPSMKYIPDAVCCAGDCMAHGVIKALESMGFNVPNDISVTGFDDAIETQSFHIPLTTVRNPIKRIANIAVSETFRLMQSGGRGKTIFVDTEFVERFSCSNKKTRGAIV